MSSTRNEHPTYPPSSHEDSRGRHRGRLRPARGVRRLRCLGARRGRRQAHLLRAVRAAAPRPGGRRHRRLRRPAHRGLQGPRPGQPGLRRAGAVLAARAPRRRPLSATPPPAPPPGRTPSRPSAPPPPAAGIALGHNGNLVNTAELRDEVARCSGAGHGRPRHAASTDSDLVTRAARRDRRRHRASRRPRCGCCPGCAGAFCLVFCDEHTLYAARDPHGVRPLVLGRLERGWVVASETAALDIVGASFVREVEPGELLAIDADGMRSARFAAPEPKGCVFEYVYLARPDTTISGRGVHATRVEIGRRLAAEAPVEADLVIPTPESGTPAAIGYAQALRHPVRPGPGEERLRRAHVHPAVARPSASSASGSSSTRCATSSAASAWSWSTTRSSAATPSARWSGCCARPARSRCTSGSPRRRCAGRASTASTSPPAPS